MTRSSGLKHKGCWAATLAIIWCEQVSLVLLCITKAGSTATLLAVKTRKHLQLHQDRPCAVVPAVLGLSWSLKLVEAGSNHQLAG